MKQRGFWSEVFAIGGSVSPTVLGRVMVFAAAGLAISLIEYYSHSRTGLTVTPFEFVGVVLGLLLVLRTNSGYDRWYEARKLWGGIVNQSRNLATFGLAYGPEDKQWRREFVKWVSAFPHIARKSLRGERNLESMRELLGHDLQDVADAQHMPGYVSARISNLLREALGNGAIDRFAFHHAENERARLIDHIGGCERILSTPLAAAFSIEIRRFLFVYLMVLPMGIVDQVGLVTPLYMMLISYPLLSLDQIGIELQNPFSKERVSHLPIDNISDMIQGNLFAMIDEVSPIRTVPQTIAAENAAQATDRESEALPIARPAFADT